MKTLTIHQGPNNSKTIKAIKCKNKGEYSLTLAHSVIGMTSQGLQRSNLSGLLSGVVKLNNFNKEAVGAIFLALRTEM